MRITCSSRCRAQALIDFKNGNGNELDGNMRSLIRSSSALAANFFHYWSRYDWPARRPLHNALGTTHADGDIRFEYKTKDYPLKAYVPNAPPPNIDVVVHYSGSGDGQPLALGIESKLHELFDRKKMTFGDTYAKEHWWADRGLPKCEALVDRIKKGSEKYEHLGADQLLKHTLGLATEFEDRFSLLYLYYDFADEPAAQQHRDEIVQFEAALGGEIKFKPMTYQALYDSLLTECQNSNSITLHKPYLDNLALRYF